MDVYLRKYLDGLSSGSVSTRIGLLEDYFKFCDCSPGEAVGWQKQHGSEYKFLDLAYSFLDSRDLMVSSKNTSLSTIRGFFLANRCPLPRDKHRFHSEKVPVVSHLELGEFKKILVACRLDYRCAFLMMFQSGSGCNELCYINTHHAGQVFDEVKRGKDVVCLIMRGRKQKRNVQSYYTFFGRDSVDCLRQLFHSRGWRRDDVLFRTQNGDPITRKCLHRYFMSVAFKLGFIEEKTPCCLECGAKTVKKRIRRKDLRVYGYLCVECGHFQSTKDYKPSMRMRAGIRYRIHTHEIRDLFRTEWHRASTYTGVDSSVGEYMMGHSIDKLEYDKIMRDRAYALSEYRKALPYLNILSEDPRKIDRTEVQNQLEAHSAEVEILKKEMAHYRSLLDNPLLTDVLSRLVEQEKKRRE